MPQQRADQAIHEAARAGLTQKLSATLAADLSLISEFGVSVRKGTGSGFIFG
jgi:hypothetical protein